MDKNKLYIAYVGRVRVKVGKRFMYQEVPKSEVWQSFIDKYGGTLDTSDVDCYREFDNWYCGPIAVLKPRRVEYYRLSEIDITEQEKETISIMTTNSMIKDLDRREF
ncbi:MAG: hypothetical protein GF411_13235, partial [Candidatus Lokiarchaeota archaeon]|nr:hypothetical protein [Candidatus Lokiarchaeota archaeon]